MFKKLFIHYFAFSVQKYTEYPTEDVFLNYFIGRKDRYFFGKDQ